MKNNLINYQTEKRYKITESRFDTQSTASLGAFSFISLRNIPSKIMKTEKSDTNTKRDRHQMHAIMGRDQLGYYSTQIKQSRMGLY